MSTDVTEDPRLEQARSALRTVIDPELGTGPFRACDDLRG